MQRAVADPYEPDLSIQALNAEALCGGEGILIETTCAGPDVDSNDFA